MTTYKPDYSPQAKADLADQKCMICERIFAKHSHQDFESCMDEIVKRSTSNFSMESLAKKAAL
jgi:hypothetical protein